MTRYLLRLYVAGTSPASVRARHNLERLCAELDADSVTIEVVDVRQDPQQAEDERIFLTPTLVRMRPEPRRRVIGDLSEADLVMAGLELERASVTENVV